MTPLRHHIQGETIAETIIALVILAIGITFSGTILANSLGNITSSKDRVVAVNIAREGVEAVRNIRDTNWLRFSGNRRDCWNHQPDSSPDACDGGGPIPAGNYVVYKDENQRWRLEPVRITDDPRFDNRWLYLVDIDPAFDSNSDRNATNDQDLYNHRLNAENVSVGISGDDPWGFQNSVRSSFRRMMVIDYLDNAGALLGSGTPGETFNRMVVTSRVLWVSGGREMDVELTTHLSDYLGRDNLES